MNNINNFIRNSKLKDKIRVVYRSKNNLKEIAQNFLHKISSNCNNLSDKDTNRASNSDQSNNNDFLNENGVIYQINCKLCNHGTYIGETGRQLKIRINEHLRLSNNINSINCSPVFLHFRSEHHCTPSLDKIQVSILRREKDLPRRKVVESIAISRIHPNLNRDGGVRSFLADNMNISN